jgi:hypothetical protein
MYVCQNGFHVTLLFRLLHIHNTSWIRNRCIKTSRDITYHKIHFRRLSSQKLAIIVLFLGIAIPAAIFAFNTSGSPSGTGSASFLGASIKSSATSPIIASHAKCDLVRYDRIPESAIVQAKQSLHIAYGHTSHGSQLITGMDALPAFKEGLGGTPGLYAWNDGPLAGALDIDDDFADGTDVGYAGWDTTTRTYLNDPSNADVNVVIWSWCGQVNDYYDQTMIDHYLSPMSQLEADYPNVKFVYMTGHLEGEGAVLTPGTTYYSNEQIRRYCRDNNKILFDFADIESYDPDGVDVLRKGATDECLYDPDGAEPYVQTQNWATEWQAAHVLGVDWYDCSPAHTEAVNGNFKAYAAWYLYARLAGWDDAPVLTPLEILGYVAIIGGAVAAVAIVVVYRKKRVIKT